VVMPVPSLDAEGGADALDVGAGLARRGRRVRLAHLVHQLRPQLLIGAPRPAESFEKIAPGVSTGARLRIGGARQPGCSARAAVRRSGCAGPVPTWTPGTSR
jgi:hypothetical protein